MGLTSSTCCSPVEIDEVPSEAQTSEYQEQEAQAYILRSLTRYRFSNAYAEFYKDARWLGASTSA